MQKPRTEFITHKQFNGYANRVFSRNMRLYGTSLSPASISRRARQMILSIEGTGMMVNPGWREAMKVDSTSATIRATNMMRKAHKGQTFAGTSYADLLITAAVNTQTPQGDESILIAALLHETVKHGILLRDIYTEFGNAVGTLVSILNPPTIPNDEELLKYLSVYENGPKRIKLEVLQLKLTLVSGVEGEFIPFYRKLIAILDGKDDA